MKFFSTLILFFLTASVAYSSKSISPLICYFIQPDSESERWDSVGGGYGGYKDFELGEKADVGGHGVGSKNLDAFAIGVNKDNAVGFEVHFSDSGPKNIYFKLVTLGEGLLVLIDRIGIYVYSASQAESEILNGSNDDEGYFLYKSICLRAITNRKISILASFISRFEITSSFGKRHLL